MIIAVDVGNTNVVLGGFTTLPDPVFIRRLPSRRDWGGQDWKNALKGLLAEAKCAEIEGAAFSSVVPEITAVLCSVLDELTDGHVVTVDSELDTGLVLVGYDRKSLGNDRVVDAVSASAQYSPPLAIFDLGTATTLSVLDEAGRLIGGMILPGLRLSVDALTAHAAQLPPFSLTAPKSLLGTDTISCMQSGAVYGTAAQIDGLSAQVENFLGQPITTVVTGGLSQLVIPYCRRQVQYDEHLLLKGLKLLYEREQRMHPRNEE